MNEYELDLGEKCIACNSNICKYSYTIIYWDSKHARNHLDLCEKCNKEIVERINEFLKKKAGGEDSKTANLVCRLLNEHEARKSLPRIDKELKEYFVEKYKSILKDLEIRFEPENDTIFKYKAMFEIIQSLEVAE